MSALACGGHAFESHSGGAGSPSLGSGGSATGVAGSVSSAGTLALAGSGQVGSAGAAVGGGGASHGGAGNGGTGNGGASNAGMSNAGAGGAEVDTCTSNSQCEVVPVGCCSCSESIENFTAINRGYETQFKGKCELVDCGPCPGAQGLNAPSLYYIATCQKAAGAAPNAEGKCVVVDLRATDITGCKIDSDCGLRSGTACCSGCSGRLVALNNNQNPELSDLVCDGGPMSCPACAPLFDGYRATCVDARCSVETTPCSYAHPCP
ncbi:MAG TPA: hypothetical protein VFK05_03025 [Polyangiaceae bacterium]|nr:hypothetical protein [Polyangiaceae bacterium]